MARGSDGSRSSPASVRSGGREGPVPARVLAEGGGARRRSRHTIAFDGKLTVPVGAVIERACTCCVRRATAHRKRTRSQVACVRLRAAWDALKTLVVAREFEQLRPNAYRASTSRSRSAHESFDAARCGGRADAGRERRIRIVDAPRRDAVGRNRTPCEVASRTPGAKSGGAAPRWERRRRVCAHDPRGAACLGSTTEAT